jgi:serine/threonine protein kinase
MKGSSSSTQLVPGFQTVRLLSEGTYSSVLLLKKIDNGVLYVLKIVPEFLSIDANQENHVEFERRVLATCNPHPFLVQHFEEWSPKVGSSLVLEYLPGGNLFALWRQQRRFLTEKEILFYAAEISLALGRLHQFGYVCRDLKLESILLDELGHIHLTNFGISGRLRGLKAVLPSKPETYGRLISIAAKNIDEQTQVSIKDLIFYVSPETLNGKGHNPSSDWWALGILLYCACIGKTPYEYLLVESDFWENCEATLRYAILNFQVSANHFPSCYSKELVDFICRLLDKNHLERLGSSSEDVEEVWKHPFLSRACKDAFLSKQVKPPFTLEPQNSLSVRRSSFLQRPFSSTSSSIRSTKPSSRMSLPEMFSRISSSPRVSLMDQDAVQGQQRASKEIKRILSEDGMKTKSVLSTLSGIGKSLKRTVLPSGRSRSNSLVLGMPFNASSVEPSPNISLDGKEPIVFGSFPSHKGESKDDRGNYIFPPGIGAIPWQPLRDANS